MRWIAQDLGEHPSSVLYQLRALMKQGLVRKARNMYVWTANLANRAVFAAYLNKQEDAEYTERSRNLNGGHTPAPSIGVSMHAAPSVAVAP